MSIPDLPPARQQPAFQPVELICLGGALLWLLGSAFAFFVSPWSSLPRAMTNSLVILLPVLMLIGAGLGLRSLRILDERLRKMNQSLAHMQAEYSRAPAADPDDERVQPSAISAPDDATDQRLAPPDEPYLGEQPTDEFDETYEEQPDLALETPEDGSHHELEIIDLIRALNFPDSADDTEGFEALHRALQNRPAAQLIQASQDMLTLLSQDSIYTDDLPADIAEPNIWRRFARGERGPEMGALGGVRDASPLGVVAARMREDAIFRDAAHHFLRRFDSLLQKAEPEMTDEDLVAMADTRTARAFMLVGRVTKAFD